MGQGDVPTSRGGPLRRRKEKRQLEHLAVKTERDGTAPPPAAAHVRVIEDRPEVEAKDRETPATETDSDKQRRPALRKLGPAVFMCGPCRSTSQ